MNNEKDMESLDDDSLPSSDKQCVFAIHLAGEN